ncbi:MAG: metallophosphoesterase [Acidobacteriota bacterium]|nr:MAG: metallophosphoesterase [Acidobacteriota bacterium]
MPAFDIIGDIHGHAEPLECLLRRLGYRDTGGAYRHPAGRKVVFLGDFIDRGPAVRRVLHVLRDMVEAGVAISVMGNHEYNALGYHTLDETGKPLRPRNVKNVVQHQATLAQFFDHRAEWRGHLRWFRSLPLFLDLGDFRVAHAAWHQPLINRLRTDRIDAQLLRKSIDKRTIAHHAIEALLKGIEIPLPRGALFRDKDGIARREIRVKWWMNPKDRTYAELSLQPSTSVPKRSVPRRLSHKIPGYARTEKPVFVGHYWLNHNPPRPLATNVACLDYSVAKGGFLCAYRWEEGDAGLRRGRFVTAPSG